MTFYRVIAEKWTKSSPGRFLRGGGGDRAGGGGRGPVSERGLTGISVFRDLGGIERVVAGRKQ